MRRTYGRSYLSIKLYLPQIIVISFFCLGIIIGPFFASTLDVTKTHDITQIIENFMVNLDMNELPTHYLLKQSILTHGKIVLFIWIFGLFPLTMPLTSLLIGIQGFSYGFTTSFFIMQYSLKGLLLCLGAYGIQGGAFVCMLYILATQSIQFSQKKTKVSFKNYLLYLLGSVIIVIVIALVEAYISPAIIRYIMNTIFNSL